MANLAVDTSLHVVVRVVLAADLRSVARFSRGGDGHRQHKKDRAGARIDGAARFGPIT
ncbi:hypothetical protein [Nocardioides sp. AN3]